MLITIYSAKRLHEVFPRHFSTLAAAELYNRQPEKIANKIYRGRMGNGNEGSSDSARPAVWRVPNPMGDDRITGSLPAMRRCIIWVRSRLLCPRNGRIRGRKM